VAFCSDAWNLVPGDTNGLIDVFVKDTSTAGILRPSMGSGGVQALGGHARECDVSSDGRYVLYCSEATNLWFGDTNAMGDLFLWDRQRLNTVRVSAASDFSEANGYSRHGKLSSDGRYMVYQSDATNILVGDTNGISDVFYRDLETNATGRISLSRYGVQADGASDYPSVSQPDANGHRMAVFESFATNLLGAGADTNSSKDIFVKNLVTGDIQRVSVSSTGAQSNGNSSSAEITPDGRYVVFVSAANALTSGDTNAFQDVFIRDLAANTTRRVSLSSAGAQPDAACTDPRVSADGRFVVFASAATNLAPGAASTQVYVRDLLLNTTTRVSVNDVGVSANNWSAFPDIDSSGRVVTYSSDATNLVADDLNNHADFFTTVLPAPRVKLANAVAPTSVYAGRYFTAYAVIRPRHTAGTYPARIYRYRYVSGRWRPYGYSNAKASSGGTITDPWSKCSAAIRLPYRGRWRLRAYAPGDSLHAATWSSAYRYVTVK
jgi:Tol biopolymer transport system component